MVVQKAEMHRQLGIDPAKGARGGTGQLDAEGYGREITQGTTKLGAVLDEMCIDPLAQVPSRFPGAYLAAVLRQEQGDSPVIQACDFGFNQKNLLAVGNEKIRESVCAQYPLNVDVFGPDTVQTGTRAGKGLCL